MNKEVLAQLNSSLSLAFSQIKGDFKDVREELEEHLLAINENTQEIQAVGDHTSELETRLEKLEGKVNEIQLLLQQLVSQTKVSIALTRAEQRVFLVLFTDESFTDVKSLALKAGVKEEKVGELLNSLSDKGVLVEREHIQDLQVFKMSSSFRDRQARENMVAIDQDIKQQFHNQLLNQFFA